MSKFLAVGDPAPRFQAPTGDHPVFHFDQVAGRFVVLSFFGSLQNAETRRAVDHLVMRHRAWFNDQNACFFGVSIDAADDEAGLLRDEPGLRWVKDVDRKVSALYGVLTPGAQNMRYEAVTYVLDPMLRVLAVIPIGPEHNAMFDAMIEGLMAGSALLVMHAPILVLPRVFEPDFCAQLMARCEAGGVAEELAGKTVQVQDSQLKRRRDFYITEKSLQAEIAGRLNTRLLPVVHQAFQFRATHIERYLLACYEAENAGFFAPHRDVGDIKGIAHRRFALTLNLNDDYDGGDLMFPEFGFAAYRAPPGGAIVFSCALLHLVTPMTRGRRFAFLPFLHDDAAESIRARNLQFSSSEVVRRG